VMSYREQLTWSVAHDGRPYVDDLRCLDLERRSLGYRARSGATMDKWLTRCANVSIVVVTAVLALWSVGFRETSGASPLRVPKEKLSLVGAESVGSARARIAVIEFADFECPYCAQVAEETVPGVLQAYVDSGRLRFVFRHLALTKIHPFAMSAGAGAACAGRQHMFWKMHDALFSSRATLTDDRIRELGTTIGLDMRQFEACWHDDGLVQVRSDGALAAHLGVFRTPTFFVGTVDGDDMVSVTEAIDGYRPDAEFQAVLDHLVGS
jgi:protein-disulfide isomerase